MMRIESRLSLQLRAIPEEVMRGVEALRGFAEQHGLSEHETFGLALALEECGSNVVNHAFQRDARQQFQVSIEHSGKAVTLELRDRGPEFDPTQAVVVGLAAPDEDRPPGGWGIHLVRRFMDEITYQRVGDENVLRLTKRLAQQPRSD